MATLVKFRVHKDAEGNEDLFAYFPKLKYDLKGYHKTCYSHIGQHSGCAMEYVKECRPATESEYMPLKQELESIGYDLKICK